MLLMKQRAVQGNDFGLNERNGVIRWEVIHLRPSILVILYDTPDDNEVPCTPARRGSRLAM